MQTRGDLREGCRLFFIKKPHGYLVRLLDVALAYGVELGPVGTSSTPR